MPGLNDTNKKEALVEDAETSTPESSTSLFTRGNINNILNISGYVLTLVTSYLGGVAGWFGGASNEEISLKYQTLITPASSYFVYIWGLIFLTQAFFSTAQLFPKYRSHPLVQVGINYHYFIACIAQIAWTISFGYQIMIAAYISMLVLFVALFVILKRQWDVVAEEEKRVKREEMKYGIDMKEEGVNGEDLTAPFPRVGYWFLRFPFAVHAGWIAPAHILMLSVLLVSYKVDADVELWVAVLGVAILFGICMGLLLRKDSGAPAYVVPGTVAYASIGIMWELNAPSDAILSRHDEASIALVKRVAGFSGLCLLVTMASRFIAIFLRDRMCGHRNDPDDDGNGTEAEAEETEYVHVKASNLGGLDERKKEAKVGHRNALFSVPSTGVEV